MVDVYIIHYKLHRCNQLLFLPYGQSETNQVAEFLDPGNPDMYAPRYAGLATFMRAPAASSLSDIDIGMLGIPYDGALTNRPGARHGPREVRSQSSLMRAINHATRVNPYRLCRIADVGDVPFTSVFDIENTHNEIEAFVKSMAAENVWCRCHAAATTQ